MMNSFWWGSKRSGGSGGINWMKWERLCKPKDFGGIGFKQLHIFNVAMLGKQMWNIGKPKFLCCQDSQGPLFP